MCSPVLKEVGNLALERQMLALQSDPQSATSDGLKLAFGARGSACVAESWPAPPHSLLLLGPPLARLPGRRGTFVPSGIQVRGPGLVTS